MSSKTYNKLHTQRRCKERFGFNLTNKMYRELIQIVQADSGKNLVKSLSRTQKVFKVVFNGQEFNVIYSNKKKSIITVLPVNSFLYSNTKYEMHRFRHN